MTRIMIGGLAIACGVALAACGGSGGAASAPTTSPAETSTARAASVDLGGIKGYLLEHTGLLSDFTAAFAADARAYHDLAAAVDFDDGKLAADPRAAELLAKMKADWVDGNPYYEQMEGIVAGTPSLAEYDVAIDAGSSAAEDPESAVPFDLTLADGRLLKQPGNFYNLTEGALWGTLPDELAAQVPSTPADLDGDGQAGFGEVLPDADFLLTAATAFTKYAGELATAANAWQPTESDAFTALVVMVPTMSEYFGDWKVSRFVAGSDATGNAFNVVSRLSDIHDILGSLEVIYGGVVPLITSANDSRARQTGRELSDLSRFVDDLYRQEQAGKRFTPEEADTLADEAQQRATAVAGQISQAGAELGITIEQ